MEHWYHAHGMVIASAVELPLPPGEPTGHPPDLTLRLGPERPVPADHPPGDRLAEVGDSDDAFFYSFGRDGDRTVLRYPELCEFAGDAELTEVTAHPHVGVNPELVAVLAAGTLLAVHLLLRDRLVLHASAVRRDGNALAFVGASGMGKSTLAAALCLAGCDLVADDVLRVELNGSARVYPGSTECRLRPNASELAHGGPARPTADGRLALRPATRADSTVPLAACIVPLPSRTGTEVVLDRLTAGQALRLLLRFPRVVGWRETETLACAFQGLAELVQVVPVYRARVPWGPPFTAGVLDDLLRVLRTT